MMLNKLYCLTVQLSSLGIHYTVFFIIFIFFIHVTASTYKVAFKNK